MKQRGYPTHDDGLVLALADIVTTKTTVVHAHAPSNNGSVDHAGSNA